MFLIKPILKLRYLLWRMGYIDRFITPITNLSSRRRILRKAKYEDNETSMKDEKRNVI